MNKLFQNPQHRANLSYNGFDLSQRVLFSSPTGQLLPVYWHYLDPGDKVNISTELKTRTMDLLASSFASINEHIEWFFVPMEQLYKFFGNVFNNIQDVGTNLVTLNAHEKDMPQFEDWRTFVYNQIDSIVRNTVSSDTLENFGRDNIRLFHMLGYPIDDALKWLGVVLPPSTAGTQDLSFGATRLSPFPFLAYQKIYSDFYRLSDRELNRPSSYNCDAWYTGQAVEYPWDTYPGLRYRPIRKDFFTSRLVSPLQGVQDIGSLGIDIQPKLDTSVAVQIKATQYSGSPSNTEVSDVIGLNSVASQNMNTMSLTAIRAMFAQDKLLAITRRSGKHYDAQTLAHFGVEVPQGISGEVMYLGAHHQPIHINDVIATAGTDTTPLGEVGGKGYGYGRTDNIKFEAKCHGVLMAIYSCDVDYNYNPMGVDKLLTYISTNDFFHPEYENLSMQLFHPYQSQTEVHEGYPSTATQWVYRYWEQKLKYPRVLGSLAYSLKYWQISKDKPITNNLVDFLVLPDFLDNIMLYKYHGNDVKFSDYLAYDKTHGFWFTQKLDVMNVIFQRDPLIHELWCDVKLASKKSVYGLPEL